MARQSPWLLATVLASSALPALAAEQLAILTLENGSQVRLKDDFTWEYVVLDQATQTLTEQAQAKPELLKVAAKDGVQVSLAQSHWQGDELALAFEVANTGSRNVVKVVVKASFYDDSGKPLKAQRFNAWLAEYRLPESYLRPGQARHSRTFDVDGLDPAQWQQGLVSLAIEEVEFR